MYLQWAELAGFFEVLVSAWIEPSPFCFVSRPSSITIPLHYSTVERAGKIFGPLPVQRSRPCVCAPVFELGHSLKPRMRFELSSSERACPALHAKTTSVHLGKGLYTRVCILKLLGLDDPRGPPLPPPPSTTLRPWVVNAL